MRHERIIKDERGTVRIVIQLHGNDKPEYSVSVWHKKPRNKKEIWSEGVATDCEIWTTKMELWEKIKP